MPVDEFTRNHHPTEERNGLVQSFGDLNQKNTKLEITRTYFLDFFSLFFNISFDQYVVLIDLCGRVSPVNVSLRHVAQHLHTAGRAAHCLQHHRLRPPAGRRRVFQNTLAWHRSLERKVNAPTFYMKDDIAKKCIYMKEI
jgi:hypothetical protein